MRLRSALIAAAAAAAVIGIGASAPTEGPQASSPAVVVAARYAAAPTESSCPAADPATGSPARSVGGAGRAGSTPFDPSTSDAGAGGGDGTNSVGDTGAPSRATTTAARLPSDVLDLSDWYLTLPTGKPGKPDTVEQPALHTLTNQFFKLAPAGDGVEFSAPGSGVTTKNSQYPRSELREINGRDKAAWSNTSGSHILDVCEAFDRLPGAKPEVVGAQIHDAVSDVMEIRLEGQKLAVQYNDGKSEQVLDPAYKLGTPYHLRIVAGDSRVVVLYNGQQKAVLPVRGSGWYFKIGAYVQSNTRTGDRSSSGAVTVYSLKVRHTGGAGSAGLGKRDPNNDTLATAQPTTAQPTGAQPTGAQPTGASVPAARPDDY